MPVRMREHFLYTKLSWPAKAGHPGDPRSMSKEYYVYTLASKRNGTLYIGVTNNLIRRVSEHRAGLVEGFTKKYDVKRLVHYEFFGDIHDAIRRETLLKKWRRQWKIDLVQSRNVEWTDLYDTLRA